MAIAFVAASAVVTGANPTVAIPTGYAEGNLLILVTSGTATPTTPTGWTQRYAQGANQFITILTKYASSSEASVALTLAGTSSIAAMLCYSGAGSYNVISTIATGTGTPATTNTQTTTYANDYVISVYAVIGNAACTLTTPTGTTSRVNSAATSTINGLLLVDELQASAGVTTARSSTLSATKPWSAISISFVPTRTLYWVGGTGTWNTSTTGNWANSSGGTPTGILPPVDNEGVIIDTSSGTGTITCTGAVCNNLTVTATQAIILGAAGSTLSVYGTLTFPNGGSFSASTNANTITMASTKASIQSIVNQSKQLSSLIIDGIGGTIGLSTSNLTATGTVTLTNGTLNLNNLSIACNAFSSSNTNTRAIQFGTGNITTTGSGVAFSFTGTNFTYTGTPTVNISNNSATATVVTTPGFTETNALNINITTGTYTLTQTNNNVYKNLNFTGSSVTFGQAAFNYTIYGNLTLSTGMTWNVTGNGVWTFAATSGTQVINLNGKTFGNITQNGVGGTVQFPAGTSTLSSVATQGGYTLTNGTLDLGTNTSTLTCFSFSSSNSNTRAISFGTGQINMTAGGGQSPLSLQTSTGLTLSGTVKFVSTYSGSTGQRQIYVGDLGLTVGAGAGNQVSFGTAGTDSILVSGTMASLDWTGFTGTWTPSVSPVTISSGNLTCSSGMSVTVNGTITFTGSSTQTITSAGKTIQTVSYTGSGTLSLVDALNCTALSVSSGTFTANNQNITAGTFTTTGTPTVNMGSGTWTISGTGTVWSVATGTTLNANTSTIAISDTTGAAITFAGAAKTYNNLTLSGTTGSTSLTISGANTFNTISSSKTVPYTITLPSSATTTVSTWSAQGSSGNLLTLKSNTSGTQASLSVVNSFTVNYALIQDNNLTSSNGTASNSYLQNVTGWTFGTATSAFDILNTTGTGYYTIPSTWNNSNNTIHLIGGGGGGAGSSASADTKGAGAGGGGGGYAKVTNTSYTAGQIVAYTVGAAGTAGAAGGATGSTAGTGGTTSWNGFQNTISYVSSATSVQNTASTTITVTVPSVSNGNLMVMMTNSGTTSPTWTTPAGWTQYGSASNGRALFWKVASSEPASYTVTQSSSTTADATIIVFANASFDTAGLAVQAASTTVTPIGITAAASNSAIVYAAGATIAGVTYSTPTGYTVATSDSDATAPSSATFYLLGVSAGSYNAPAVTGTGSSRAYVISLSPTFGSFSVTASGGAGGASTTTTSTGGTGGTGSISGVTFVAETKAQTTTGSLTLTVPTGTTGGDLMIAVLPGASSGSDTFSTLSGWTVGFANSNGMCVQYRTYTSGDPSSFTFTMSSGTSAAGYMITYRNATWDAVGTYGNPFPSVTTTASNCVVVAAGRHGITNSTITVTSAGFTYIDNYAGTSPAMGSAIYSKTQAAAGASGTATATYSGAGSGGGIQFSIKPSYVGSTFTGGTGGTGAISTAASTGNGAGGGGGAAGPNGNGGNGGNGSSGLTPNFAGGGGGGNGGGTAGGNASTSTSGAGGNNSSGTGGGAAAASNANGNVGTIGGGGSGGGGGANNIGGAGGAGVDILSASATVVGSGGGSGGSTSGTSPGFSGLYGGGSGGTGNSTTSGNSSAGAAGRQGVIFITWVPLNPPPSLGNYFLLF